MKRSIFLRIKHVKTALFYHSLKIFDFFAQSVISKKINNESLSKQLCFKTQIHII